MTKYKYNPGNRLGPNNILFLERIGKRNNHWYGKFQCPYCNNQIGFIARIDHIVTGHTSSCGCLKTIDLTGQKFGRLTALYPTSKRSGTSIKWACICDCNSNSIVYISANGLNSGNTKSCGCLQKEKASQTHFIDLLNKQFGYLLVKEYAGSDPKFKLSLWRCECLNCGNKNYIVSSNNLLQNRVRSCGCISSKGEVVISQLLDKLQIKYNKQYKFNNCINPKTGYHLRFDFYLPDYNCCIEYDGEQHFRPSSGWNNQQNFEETQQRDKIKNLFCQRNNIKIIRIPYYDYHKIDDNYIITRIISNEVE